MERKERSLVHCLKGQPTLSAPLGAPSLWDLLALGSCDGRNLWKTFCTERGKWTGIMSLLKRGSSHLSGAQAGPCRADDQQLAPGAAGPRRGLASCGAADIAADIRLTCLTSCSWNFICDPPP